MRRLLLATNNEGKISEYRRLLAGCGWELVSPREIGLSLEVAETGGTYEENARLKAQRFAAAGGLYALADDSGLEVDALGGRPGPLSARYGGEGLDDAGRVRLLLLELGDTPDERRSARFRAVIVVAGPEGDVHVCQGTVEGRIARAPRGDNGFGYDPVFLLPDQRRTAAELSPAEKNAVSHRGAAARKACALLKSMAG